jgi:hypothetical protein
MWLDKRKTGDGGLGDSGSATVTQPLRSPWGL